MEIVWAVLDGDEVVNRIVAANKEIAESASGKTCVLAPTLENYGQIGSTWNGSQFSDYEAYEAILNRVPTELPPA